MIRLRSKEEFLMSNSTNRTAVPEAKGALERFKYEVAGEIGVPLSDGYNGDLTSKQNGSVGGYMVNIMYPEQHTVFYRHLRSFSEHMMPIEYTYSLVI